MNLILPPADEPLVRAAADAMERKGKSWGGSYGGFGWQVTLGKLFGLKSHVDARRVLERCRDGEEMWGIDGKCDFRVGSLQLDPKSSFKRNNGCLITGDKVVDGVYYVYGELQEDRWPAKTDPVRDRTYELIGYGIGGVHPFKRQPFVNNKFALENHQLGPVSELIAWIEEERKKL